MDLPIPQLPSGAADALTAHAAHLRFAITGKRYDAISFEATEAISTYISPERIQQTPFVELHNDQLYSALNPLHLPKFGIVERKVWPALVFTRNADKS